MDFLQGYSDEEEEEHVPEVEEVSKPQEDDGELLYDYEQDPNFNADEPPVSFSESDDSDSDSDDEYGPKPVLAPPTNPSKEEGQVHVEQAQEKMENPVSKQTKKRKAVLEEDTLTNSAEKIEEYAVTNKIPIENEVTLTGNSKATTCISVEPAGNRFVAGSLDYNVKLYDFGGMDSRHRAFNTVEVDDGHPILAISHSPSGDKFVVATSSAQPKVFDRDGNEIIKFVKGDMYLRDLSNTKGHTMEVTHVVWHPTDKNLILTSSLDGTLRIWNLLGEATFGMLINQTVLKMKSLHNANLITHRIAVTTCAYAPKAGEYVIGGTSLGNLQLWFTHKRTYNANKPDIIFSSPFGTSSGAGEETRSVQHIAISYDNSILAARYDCGMIYLWNMSKITSAVNVTVASTWLPVGRIDGVYNIYSMANVTFSPDNRFVACAASSTAAIEKKRKQQEKGEDAEDASGAGDDDDDNNEEKKKEEKGDEKHKSKLHVYDITSLTSLSPPTAANQLQPVILHPKVMITIGYGHQQQGIYVTWTRTTQQLFLSFANGEMKLYYHPAFSTKGVLLSVRKAPKREKDPTDFAVVGEIQTPNALPMFATDNPREAFRKKREQLKDPVIAKIPEKPSTQGPGKRTNTSFFFTNYITNNQVTGDLGKIRAQDPRAALLKYDAIAKQDPRFLGKAYAQTQPITALHAMTFEEEQAQFKEEQKLHAAPGKGVL